MTTQAIDQLRLPRVRDGLTIREISATEFVVRTHESREYFSLGPQEACLLQLLDGRHSFQDIQRQFRESFSDNLSESDLQQFVDAIKPMGLLRSTSTESSADTHRPRNHSSTRDQTPIGQTTTAAPDRLQANSLKKRARLSGQSVLFFRIPLCDPDRFLSRLTPAVPILWTRGFLVFAAGVMLTALCVMVSSGAALASGIPSNIGWAEFVLFIGVMLGCTALHEMAHGATLKHFGGEVHDTGLLFMFFTPCMYCNVSDAWLLSEKWKRLAVTVAGGICDLCLWATGVFIWRLTVVGTSVNQLAFLVLTICGGRSLLNFNPLLRLDGYYLLSDWLSIPNLRPRAMEHWMGNMRWLLWGAARPPSIPQSRVLLVYGLMCWVFALVFLDLIFLQFFGYMSGQFGLTGLAFVVLLLMFGFRRVFKGFFAGEFGAMLKTRPKRTATWTIGLLVSCTLLFVVPVRSTTSGEFEIRPGNVVQLHVPVAGIVQSVAVEDGSVVEEGQLIAELKSPSLESEILKTEDLLREVEASLSRLKAGTRSEELTAQTERVARLAELYELGAEELRQARVAHDQELLIQQHRIQETTAQLENAKQDLAHSEQLYRQGALAGAQLRAERLQLMQIESRLAQTQAATSAARATGIRAKEAEIGKRSQELADARSVLDLMKAGSRPEDIAAEEARRERVDHELTYLKSQKGKLQLRAPTSGIFSAPRLPERIGQVAVQDTLFCTIEKPETSRVEISVSEDDAAHLKSGQTLTLKVRAIPFETFEATVEGIAATASKGTGPGLNQNVVVVHCRIRNPDGRLKSGMTGFGRITRGWNSIGMIVASKGLKYLRTEFWW